MRIFGASAALRGPLLEDIRDISRNYTPVTFAHPAMQPGKPSCERKLYDIVVVVVVR